MSKYAVIYSSLTGNTEKIATAIYQAIPSQSKDICRIDEITDIDIAENYFIGFQIDNCTAPHFVSFIMKKLNQKNIALFATYGYSTSDNYVNLLLSNMKDLVPQDNQYFGSFLCKGKMPISVRNKYTEMLARDEYNIDLIHMIYNFDQAMLHPNTEDEVNAADFAKKIAIEMENSPF